MKRVLQMMGGLNRGGLETFVMNVYRQIDRNSIQFDFLVNAKGDYAEEIERLGGRIFVLPARNQVLIKSRKFLNDFFKLHASEYVACHAHVSSLSAIKGLEVAKKFGIPVRVIHGHSSSISKSVRFHYVHLLLHYLHKTKVRKIATHFLGCSDKSLDWLYNYTGVRNRAMLIKNGISVKEYSYSQLIDSQVRNEFGVLPSSIVMGHVGRFIPLKNHGYLVDIFNDVHRRNPDSKLILIGDGETKKDVEQYVEQLGLKDDVLFLGIREDVSRILQMVDFFVMPSWFEGLPVSLVEAQAAGCFVVASDTISKDSKITESFIFVSINENVTKWADIIVNNAENMHKPNNSQIIKDAGFDSKSIAQELTDIYLSKV